MSEATRKSVRLALVIALGAGMVGATAASVVVIDDEDGVVQVRHDPGGRHRSEAHPMRGAQRGWLGIVMYGQSGDGTIIKELIEEGPAAEAGLRKGDRILAIDGAVIEDYWDITNALEKKEPGDRVEIEIDRDGDEMDLDVTLGERPGRSRQIWHSFGDDDVKILSPGRGRVIRLGGHRPILGVDVKEMSEDLRGFFKAPDDAGVLINRVIENTPAERAGLRPGDVIIEVDGKEIGRVGDISRALRSREAGDEVAVVVIRDRKTKTLDVTLEERDDHSRLWDLEALPHGLHVLPAIEGLEGLESLRGLEGLEHHRLTREKRDELRRSMREVREQLRELREQMRSMRMELNERRGELQDEIRRRYERALEEAHPAGYDI